MAWVPIALVVVILGLGAWYALGRAHTTSVSSNANAADTVTNTGGVNSNVDQNTNTAPTNANVVANTNAAPFPQAGWSVYRDGTYGFSFQFPSEWTVTRLDPNKSLPGSPEQVWPDAVSVRPPQAQEELPSFKAVPGDYSAALAWLDAHIEPYAANGQTMPVGGLTARIVKTKRGAGDTFAIVEAPQYALIVLLDPATYWDPPVPGLYKTILATFRFSSS
jgi:hypothetical protein